MKWPKAFLHDVCRPKQWPTISTADLKDDGYPVYGANGKIGFYSEYTHQHPTALITCRGATCGTINICEPFSYVNGNAMALDQLDPRVDLGFLAHYLRQRGLADAISGSAQPQITREGLRHITIPLPPLEEQRRIAAILDKADALRQKRRLALQKLDSLTQSIFLDMFGDPITNPQKFSRVKLQKVCKRITVGIVVKPASYYVSEGVPALRSLNIRRGAISLQGLVYFSKSDNETKLTKTRLRAGDLVLVRSGQPGTAAVVPLEMEGINAIDLLIATPLPELADADYLCEFFNSHGGKDLVLSNQRGQVQKHLNVSSLSAAPVPLPPMELQREFARRLRAIKQAKAAQSTSASELQLLFASLQHRAFRGEL